VIPFLLAIDFTETFDWGGFATTRVPVEFGRREFNTTTGIFFWTAGRIVLGCNTFAPKYASSEASLYEIVFNFFAFGVICGSAVSMPSTSVQIWISSAFNAAPIIAAE